LLPAHRGRDAEMGDGLDDHAVAASSHRRQGRRRKPQCRRRAVLRQRGERRLQVPRLDPHPDAARPLAHLDGRRQVGPARVATWVQRIERSISVTRAPLAPPLPACGERSDSERSEAERWNPGEGALPQVRACGIASPPPPPPPSTASPPRPPRPPPPRARRAY